VREALEAATGGVVSQTPEQVSKPESDRETIDKSKTTISKEAGTEGTKAEKVTKQQERGERREKTRRSGSDRSARRRKAQSVGHQKTSTGYMKTTGQEIVRLTLHLTPAQKRKLKIKSLEAGFDNASAYIVKELNL